MDLFHQKRTCFSHAIFPMFNEWSATTKINFGNRDMDNKYTWSLRGAVTLSPKWLP